MAQHKTNALSPAGIGFIRSKGHRSQTKVSWSIATKIVAASGIRNGNVGNVPPEWNIAPKSALPTMTWAMPVRTSAATMKITVFTIPAPGRDLVRLPGQPCHHAATTISTGSQNVLDAAMVSRDWGAPKATLSSTQRIPTISRVRNPTSGCMASGLDVTAVRMLTCGSPAVSGPRCGPTC